jgi:hypothetical protein
MFVDIIGIINDKCIVVPKLCYFCISHILTVLPITVPSDTGVVFAIDNGFLKEICLSVNSFDSQVSAVRFSTELTLEDIPTQKKLFLNFDLSYMSCMNKKNDGTFDHYSK